MCFKKRNNNKPVRLQKQQPSIYDELKVLLSTPEVLIIIGVMILLIISIFLAMGETSWYYTTKV